MDPTWLWAGFVLVVGVMLALDLGVLRRQERAMSLREAAVMTGLWCALAAAFAVAVLFVESREKALQFGSCYLLELSLSVDNLFVFILLFRFFRVSPEHQPRILQWGILGAIAMRFVFIFAGVKLVHAFHPVIYAFGALLVWTGVQMLRGSAEKHDPGKSVAVRALHRVLPVTESPHGRKFFTRLHGTLHATPLFAALVAIEASDLVFAIDSIPAALGVTSDGFVVYTSNIFAIMGLRSLYFLLEGSMERFRHLGTGVSLVLVFIGAKMLVSGVLHVPTSVSLGVIGATIAASILASLR